MKRFLLTCGDNHYPCSGAQDWIDFFSTYDEALTFVKCLTMYFDWFSIVDIEDFENAEVVRWGTKRWKEVFNEGS